MKCEDAFLEHLETQQKVSVASQRRLTTNTCPNIDFYSLSSVQNHKNVDSITINSGVPVNIIIYQKSHLVIEFFFNFY